MPVGNIMSILNVLAIVAQCKRLCIYILSGMVMIITICVSDQIKPNLIPITKLTCFLADTVVVCLAHDEHLSMI